SQPCEGPRLPRTSVQCSSGSHLDGGFDGFGFELLGFVTEVLEEDGGDIAFAEAGNDDDDQLASVFVAAGDLNGGVNRGAGGDADEEAFFEGQATGHGDGVV